MRQKTTVKKKITFFLKKHVASLFTFFEKVRVCVYVYGWIKMVATMVDRRQKLRWLKRPETIPQKTKFGPKNNSKPHIWSLSLNFNFFSRKSESQQKLAKKIIHFRIKFPSKNIRFTNHNSLNIIKSIFPQNTAKNLTTLRIFQQTCFWLILEKAFALHLL